VIAVWVASFGLILTRVATFVNVVPIIGGGNTPRLVKLGLAMALAVFWFNFEVVPSAVVLTRAAEISWVGYGLALGREAVLGTAIGYVLGLFLVPARVAGEFITQQMGLSLGATIDPASNTSMGAVTHVFEMLAILLFFGLDGHHVFLAVMHGSFARWPIGGPLGELPTEAFITGGAMAQEWGVLIAAPVAACMFLTTTVLALMARAAPQMNVFSVGFALQIGTGLLALWLLMPNLLSAMVAQFERLGDYLVRLV
jgi:flagellar biosynthetic protein FliR